MAGNGVTSYRLKPDLSDFPPPLTPPAKGGESVFSSSPAGGRGLAVQLLPLDGGGGAGVNVLGFFVIHSLDNPLPKPLPLRGGERWSYSEKSDRRIAPVAPEVTR